MKLNDSDIGIDYGLSNPIGEINKLIGQDDAINAR